MRLNLATMDEQLSQLEHSIDSLVGHVAELQVKYGLLLEEKESWQAQRTTLKDRCDAACERIDEILSQIHLDASVGED